MGLRGPAPKSRDSKILAGTFRKDRDRGAAIAPPPLTTAPKSPGWLSAAGKAEWRRMASEMMALNALTAIDLKALEGYCAAYARAVAAEKALTDGFEGFTREGTVVSIKGLTMLAAQGLIPRPEIAIAKAAWAEMRSFAAKLGASPADHTRVKAGAEPAKAQRDPWAGLAANG